MSNAKKIIFGSVIFSIVLYVLSDASSTQAITPHACSIKYGSVFNWWSLQGNWTGPWQHDRNKLYVEKYNQLFSVGADEGQANWWQVSTGENTYYWTKVDQIQQWFASNNKEYIYHAVTWHHPSALDPQSSLLGWYKQLPSNTHRQDALKIHIETVVKRFNNKATKFVLINHPLINGSNSNYLLTGWDKITAQTNIYKWAVAANSQAIYILNESWPDSDVQQRTSALKAHIELLRQKGARVDAIGLMAHMGMCDPKVPANEVLSQSLDQLGQLQIPMYITELDVSYDRCNVNGGDTNQDFNPLLPYEGYNDYYQYQAATYKRLMELFTSKNYIKQISFWGFYDGRHWRKDVGFFYTSDDSSTDFSPKPSYFAIKPYLTYQGCSQYDPDGNGYTDWLDYLFLKGNASNIFNLAKLYTHFNLQGPTL